MRKGRKGRKGMGRKTKMSSTFTDAIAFKGRGKKR